MMRYDNKAMIDFTLNGVYSWKRMAATYRGKKMVYYPPKSNKVRAWHTIATFLQTPHAFTPQLNVPASLYISVYDNMELHDLDNVAKMIMDSLQPLVIANDNLIYELHVTKHVLNNNIIPMTKIKLIFETVGVSENAEEIVLKPKRSAIEDIVAKGGLLVKAEEHIDVSIRLAEKYDKFFIRYNNAVNVEMTWKTAAKSIKNIIREQGDEFYLIQLTTQH